MDNPPAFPEGFGDPRNPGWIGGGMSLRDWFAGQALATLVAQHHRNDWGMDGVRHYPICAEKAYRAADAMLEARKPKEETTNA